MTDENVEHVESSETTKKVNRYLLTDESFTRLRDAQQRISNATEFAPSLRKLINELVNHEAVEKLTERFIETLK